MYGQAQNLCGFWRDHNLRAVDLVIACVGLGADFITDYVQNINTGVAVPRQQRLRPASAISLPPIRSA